MLFSLLDRVRATDPRIYQMTVQATLLTHGLLFLDFDAFVTRLHARYDREANTMAELTGWKLDDVKRRMGLPNQAPKGGKNKWYEGIWK